MPLGWAASALGQCPLTLGSHWASWTSRPPGDAAGLARREVSTIQNFVQEDFYHAQRRHRRATWRLSGLGALTVAVMGLPLSVVISPLLLALFAICNDLLSLAVRTPDYLTDLNDRLHRNGTAMPLSWQAKVLVLVVLSAPGVVVMVIVGAGVRRLFRKDGAGAIVLSLGARPPNPDDLEEAQLVNIVGAVAIAAGVPAPNVRVLDSDVVNAAAVGRTKDDAVVVIPRRVLTDLGREPTEAVVGHLVASIVNGDLRISMDLASLFETVGVIQVMLSAPFDRPSRQVARRLLRLVLGRSADPNEAQTVIGDLIAASHTAPADRPPTSHWAGLVRVIGFPIRVAGIAFGAVNSVVGSLLVRPIMGHLWRRRRLLADATAVALLRDPDAMLQALEYLQANAGALPVGPWQHLFIVGGKANSEDDVLSSFQPPMEQRVRQLVALGASPDSATRSMESRSGCVVAALWILGVVFVPLGLAMAITVVAITVGFSLLVDLLLVLPVVLLVHVLTRG